MGLLPTTWGCLKPKSFRFPPKLLDFFSLTPRLPTSSSIHPPLPLHSGFPRHSVPLSPPDDSLCTVALPSVTRPSHPRILLPHVMDLRTPVLLQDGHPHTPTLPHLPFQKPLLQFPSGGSHHHRFYGDVCPLIGLPSTRTLLSPPL